MSIFNKITHIIDLPQNTTKEQAEEALNLFSPAEENEMRNLIAASSKDLWPRPNDDIEFIVPLFNAKKHYKHLKRMMWKYGKRY